MAAQKGYSISRHAGSWQVRVRDPHLRTYRTKNFENRGEAEEWASTMRARFEVRVDQGRSPRLSELAVGYLMKCEAGGRSQGHLQALRWTVERAVSAGLDDLMDPFLPERTALWLSRLVAKRHGQRTGKPASARTKNHYLLMLRSIANYGWRKGVLLRNPFLAVDLQREMRCRKPMFTLSELCQISDPANRDHSWWLFGVVVLYTGMRSAEARAMTWNWIDWDKRCIRLPAVFTKTGTDRRIPLQSELAEIVRSRAQLGSQPVFPREIAQLDSNDANKEFQAYLRSIGITPRRPEDARSRSIHCLRHAAACLLTATGLSPFLVMDYLGHTHIATSKHYSTGAQEFLDEVRTWPVGVFRLQPAMQAERQTSV